MHIPAHRSSYLWLAYGGPGQGKEPACAAEDRAQSPRSPRGYLDGLKSVIAGELANHRKVSRLHYSRRCAEASAVQAHMKQGIPLAPGMEIGYVIRDARKWEVDPERTASKFDAVYYRGLLEKAWGEAAFVFARTRMNK